MRFAIRFERGEEGLTALDLQLVDDVTIGELADHLGALEGLPSGLTIAGSTRSALVRDAGPTAGSIVRLDVTEPPVEPTPAPVRLIHNVISGHPAGIDQSMNYGDNAIGGLMIKVSDRVELRPSGNQRVIVNGLVVIGTQRLANGDMVVVFDPAGSTDSTWRNDDSTSGFVVEIDGPLAPPAGGPFIPHRHSPRVHEELHRQTVPVPSPPDSSRTPGMPVLSAIVPLLLGAGLWVMTRSLASAAFVLFSFVYIVASGIESRREFRKEAEFRETQFHIGAERAIDTLEDAHENEGDFLDRHAPDPTGLSDLIGSHDERIWERSLDDSMGGPLVVRLGTGWGPGSTVAARPTHGRPDLVDDFVAQLSAAEFARLPVTVDLDLGGGLGLIGTDESTTGLARWIVIQLAALLGPDQLQILVLCAEDRRHEWDWVTWLPHTRSKVTAGPRRSLVVVDGASDDSVRSAIAECGESNTRLLWITTTRSNLPAMIRQSVDVAEPASLVIADPVEPSRFIASPATDLDLHSITTDAATSLAIRLTPLVHSPALGAPHTGSSTSCGLRDVLTNQLVDSPTQILTRWRDTEALTTLVAPVGTSDGSLVSLDLFTDGPHALVAGMTGSGKSELLRSWITSMALSHSPSKVTFLLIDYKGGAAFGPLDSLPHAVGFITDLDTDLASRAMVSLRAELLRREQWIASSGAGSLAQAVEFPDKPPALIVVVDEFATLAKELPGFVDELVDIAQRGRSLGIHLVLATQRPHGVVSESIRANTSIRIALRVADQQDSMEVIDVADAAEIDRETPGTGIVRIGQSRSNPVRFAHSSSQYSAPPRIVSTPFGLSPDRLMHHASSGPSDLERAVASVSGAFSSTGSAPPRQPWVEPLPTQISLQQFSAPSSADHLPIGMVDRPDLQRLDPMEIDLRSSTGIAIFGCTRSGRSTTLATIATAAVENLRRVRVYSIGLDIPSADDSIELDDHDRVLRLLRLTHRRLNRAVTPADSHGEKLMILIDDIALFERRYESMNRSEAMSILEDLLRSGTSHGINVCIGAGRRMDLDPALMGCFGTQILLRTVSEDEAALLGAPPALAGQLPAGRGLFGNNWIQIAHPAVQASASVDRVKVPIAGLPPVVSLNDIAVTVDQQFGSTSTSEPTNHRSALETLWEPVIGMSPDTFEPVHLDLTHGGAVVGGPRRSGRTNTLQAIASSVRNLSKSGLEPVTTVLISRSVSNTRSAISLKDFNDAQSMGSVHEVRPWDVVVNTEDHDELVDQLSLIRQWANDGRLVLVCVEEYPELADSVIGPELDQALIELVGQSGSLPTRVVLSGQSDALSRCYSQALTKVRSNRTGVLLGTDPDTDGSLLGCHLARRDEWANAAGLGWVVNEGEPTATKLAVV